MLPFEWLSEPRYRTPLLLLSAGIIVAIVIAELSTSRPFAPDRLCVFPVMLAAAFLPAWATVLLGSACALLVEHFNNLVPSHTYIRVGIDALALSGSGLFTAAALRGWRANSEAFKRFQVLAETSSLAMLTFDERGAIVLANFAAVELLSPRDRQLIGRPIAGFLPALHFALCWEDAPQFRTSMECCGHRDNGQPFLAKVWLSGFKERSLPRVSAIVVDTSEPQCASQI